MQFYWRSILFNCFHIFSFLFQGFKLTHPLFQFLDFMLLLSAGVVGLQAAAIAPQICRGIILLNISLRMLHIKKQPWFARPFISSFQRLLRYKWNKSFFMVPLQISCLGQRTYHYHSFSFRNTAVGKFFFKAVATKESVRNILCQVLPL